VWRVFGPNEPSVDPECDHGDEQQQQTAGAQGGNWERRVERRHAYPITALALPDDGTGTSVFSILGPASQPQWFPPSSPRLYGLTTCATAGVWVRCVRVTQTRWWQRQTRAAPSGSRRPTDSPPASRRQQQLQNLPALCGAPLPQGRAPDGWTDCPRDK
jgi:hypothetical protein